MTNININLRSCFFPEKPSCNVFLLITDKTRRANERDEEQKGQDDHDDQEHDDHHPRIPAEVPRGGMARGRRVELTSELLDDASGAVGVTGSLKYLVVLGTALVLLSQAM